MGDIIDLELPETEMEMLRIINKLTQDLHVKIQSLYDSFDKINDGLLLLDDKTNKQFENLDKRLKKLEMFIFGHEPYEKNLAHRVQDVEQWVLEFPNTYMDILGLEDKLNELSDWVSNFEYKYGMERLR